ncbi:hypothetical protein DFH29DRAFT_508145 [Suillus ampliporus]|nr:hypothetical protein DFH29DRAFT_508145 [Suillus ampliporus]
MLTLSVTGGKEYFPLSVAGQVPHSYHNCKEQTEASQVQPSQVGIGNRHAEPTFGPPWKHWRGSSWYFGSLAISRPQTQSECRICGTSESDSLLREDQIRFDLQRDHTPNAPLCSICARTRFPPDSPQWHHRGRSHPARLTVIHLEKIRPMRILPPHIHGRPSNWLLDKFPQLDLSGLECGLFSLDCVGLREPTPEPKKLSHRLSIHTSDRPRRYIQLSWQKILG